MSIPSISDATPHPSHAENPPARGTAQKYQNSNMELADSRPNGTAARAVDAILEMAKTTLDNGLTAAFWVKQTDLAPASPIRLFHAAVRQPEIDPNRRMPSGRILKSAEGIEYLERTFGSVPSRKLVMDPETIKTTILNAPNQWTQIRLTKILSDMAAQSEKLAKERLILTAREKQRSTSRQFQR